MSNQKLFYMMRTMRFKKLSIEQGILVPLDKDEFEYVRYLYERDVVRDSTLQLTLITTRQCNLRCVYCYEEHEDKHMSQTVYENLLKFIEKMLKERVSQMFPLAYLEESLLSHIEQLFSF